MRPLKLISAVQRNSTSSALALLNIWSIHCSAIKLGKIADLYTANNILSYYSKWQYSLADKLFDEMPHRDTVSWNTMIAAFANAGDLGTSWELHSSMRKCGFLPDGYTFGSVLKGVASAVRLDLGQQVHSLLVKMGYQENVYVGSALLDMYAKCERVDDAYLVFQCMPNRNFVSWNALISGFVQAGDREMAFYLLSCLEEEEGAAPDDGTISPLLTLLNDDTFYNSTRQLHCKIIKHGLGSHNTVCNATITAYSECGSLENAKRVFHGSVLTSDLVTWNSMLAAYLLHGEQKSAFKLFLDMQGFGFDPDIYTYTSIISSCVEKVHKDHGRSVHGLVIKRGLEQSVPICNALIALYAKANNKSMEAALNLFQSMESRDRISCNSILTGFSQMGLGEDALKFFAHMRSSLVDIDDYAFSAVLRSCSDLATLQLGQLIHGLAVKSGYESNDFVASALMFMYSKCGIVENARKLFEETHKASTILWNSIIFAYAQHGLGNVALEFFSLMRERNVKLDHITFVAVLTACSHIGLVEQGRHVLKSMESDYGIQPRMEHYACVVDLLGRAGHLHKARAVIESMPFRPDAMVWKTFLGACRACGNIELAAQVASHLLEIEPEEHCTYVILANMYGHLKRWDDKAGVKRLMRERNVRKVPGRSWIEVKNEVYAFNADDKSHSQCDDIYQRVGELMGEIKWLHFVTNLDCLVHELDDVWIL